VYIYGVEVSTLDCQHRSRLNMTWASTVGTRSLYRCNMAPKQSTTEDSSSLLLPLVRHLHAINSQWN